MRLTQLFQEQVEAFFGEQPIGPVVKDMSRPHWPDGLSAVRTPAAPLIVVVYDHAFEGDRAWFRFAFKWNDPKTAEPRSMAGFQSYRIEGGKLVETWLSIQPIGSSWPDTIAQEHWTSQRP